MSYKKRVLVVNDENGMLEQLKRWLLFYGYDVETTCSGEMGINLLQQKVFDLILLDYNLNKEKDGHKTASTFIPKIKNINPSIPIIVMSATEVNLSAIELGVSDMILVDSSFWKNILRLIAKNLSSYNKSKRQ